VGRRRGAEVFRFLFEKMKCDIREWKIEIKDIEIAIAISIKN